jgi:putative membrane protein
MLTTTALLADANQWHHDHWWIWPFMWTLLILVAISLVWFRRGRFGVCGPHRGDPARAILGERYARGEISTDEYRERLDQLP